MPDHTAATFEDDEPLGDKRAPASWQGPSLRLGTPELAALLNPDPALDPTGTLARAPDEGAPLLAYLHGADGALLCGAGTAGVAQLVSEWLPSDFDVLLARDTASPIVDALLSRHRDFSYVATDHLARFDSFGQVNLTALELALAACPRPVALFVSSTGSYGTSPSIAAVVDLVHRHDPRSVVVADGSREATTNLLAAKTGSAIGQRADLVLTSPAASLGALEGAAALVWLEDRVDRHALRVAAATSGLAEHSPLVAASTAAATRRLLTSAGAIERTVATADALRRRISRRLPRLDLVKRRNGLEVDPLRVAIGLTNYAMTGYELRHELQRRRTTVQAAGTNTVLAAVRLDHDLDDVDALVDLLADVLGGHELESPPSVQLPHDPFATLQEKPACSPVVASHMSERQGTAVALSECVGQISCQRVGVASDSVPVLVPGFRATAGAVRYLEAAIEAGSAVDVPGGWTGDVVVAPPWLGDA